VVSVGENIIFDPTREEISVAEAVLAVSIVRSGRTIGEETGGNLKLLSIRTIDPPSRMTNPGIPNSENAATIGFGVREESAQTMAAADTSIPGEEIEGVWKPRRGGVKRGLISQIVKMVLQKGGVGDEVMDGLEGVEVQ
jgi:exosome complex component RRP42